MANARALVELRREGFVTAECDRRMGPFLVKDLYGFGDVMGYDPTHLRRPRLVNGCLEDLPLHIHKYLQGFYTADGKHIPPNEHLVHLIKYFDLYIYSFVKRTMRDNEGKLLKRKTYVCRKWKAIVSPEGQVSFCLEEDEDATALEAESGKAELYRNILVKIKHEVAERDYGEWGNKLHAFLKEAGL